MIQPTSDKIRDNVEYLHQSTVPAETDIHSLSDYDTRATFNAKTITRNSRLTANLGTRAVCLNSQPGTSASLHRNKSYTKLLELQKGTKSLNTEKVHPV